MNTPKNFNKETIMFTGDPFVDTGSVVIEILQKIYSQKELIDLIYLASNWFIYKWDGKIDSLQLNSMITHNSRRGSQEKREKAEDDTMKFFKKLFNSEGITFEGYCRICGKNEKLFKAGREIYPISGSSAFVNYHHSHEEGLLLCKDCITKLFFLPLAVVQMGGKLAILHLHNEATKNYWINKVIKVNLNDLSRNISTGILKSDLKNPKNALFSFATDIILTFNIENDYLQLYHFTNFGTSPDCEIYTLPNPVFRYLSKVLKSVKKDWYYFLKKFYNIKNAVWDIKTNEWVKKSKNKTIDFDEYKDNRNEVIEKLLYGKSLLPIFRKFYKENFQNNKEVSILLLDYYLKEVKNMNTKQIELIKRIGKSVIEIAKKDDNNFKKYLTMIEGTSRAHQLRAALIHVIKKHYSNGEKTPLITLEEYVNYLFPDGSHWSEVRDILIIYLYELLHKENIEGVEIDEINLKTPEEELTEF